MSFTDENHIVEVAGLKLELPLFEISPGVIIPMINILGEAALVEKCAEALAEKLAAVEYDVIIAPEIKAIPLAHALSVKTGKGYVILRKHYKPYLGDTIEALTETGTTSRPRKLILENKDVDRVRGKRVVLLDDVVSTGSIQNGMRRLVNLAGAEVAAEAAIFTEGETIQAEGLISLGHLPIFTQKDSK